MDHVAGWSKGATTVFHAFWGDRRRKVGSLTGSLHEMHQVCSKILTCQVTIPQKIFQTRTTRALLGAPGLTTRSKGATRGSWHRYGSGAIGRSISLRPRGVRAASRPLVRHAACCRRTARRGRARAARTNWSCLGGPSDPCRPCLLVPTLFCKLGRGFPPIRATTVPADSALRRPPATLGLRGNGL